METELKVCSKCKESKVLSDFYYDNTHSCYYSECKKCKNKQRVINRSKNQLDNRHQLKQKAIEYKGGRCAQCGYEEHMSAFDFHHLNPLKKDYCIGTMIARSYNWEKIKKELDKCIVLCANCHRKLHWDD